MKFLNANQNMIQTYIEIQTKREQQIMEEAAKQQATMSAQPVSSATSTLEGTAPPDGIQLPTEAAAAVKTDSSSDIPAVDASKVI